MTLLYKFPDQDQFTAHFRHLTDADWSRVFGAEVVSRARSYVHDIDRVEYDAGHVRAKVFGSHPYNTQLELRKNQLYGNCSCPFGGGCKHLAALVLHVQQKATDAELAVLNQQAVVTIPLAATSFSFEQWLTERSEKELRALVLQFAPPSFRQGLALQAASSTERERLFADLEGKVRQLLKSAQRYDSAAFEETLLTTLERLRPLWSSLPDETARLLADVLGRLSDLEGEGVWYDEYNEGFEGQGLGLYLADFVKSLAPAQVATPFKRLVTALDGLEYVIAENFLSEVWQGLTRPQWAALTVYLSDKTFLQHRSTQEQELLWGYLKTGLDEAQQHAFLRNCTGDFAVLGLVTLYEEKGELKEAFSLLEKGINAQKETNVGAVMFGAQDNPLLEKRLSMEKAYRNGQELEHWAKQYVETKRTAHSLQVAVQYTPAQRAQLEQLLYDRNPLALAEYYEKTGDLQKVIKLFDQRGKQISADYQYSFYRKHKEQFVERATALFKRRLDDALVPTRDSAYQQVVELLAELKVIMPRQALLSLINTIRLHYKRRTKLLSMMEAANL